MATKKISRGRRFRGSEAIVSRGFRAWDSIHPLPGKLEHLGQCTTASAKDWLAIRKIAGLMQELVERYRFQPPRLEAVEDHWQSLEDNRSIGPDIPIKPIVEEDN